MTGYRNLAALPARLDLFDRIEDRAPRPRLRRSTLFRNVPVRFLRDCLDRAGDVQPVTPDRNFLTVAPSLGPVEDVDAKLGMLGHGAYPPRIDVGRVIMRGLADFRQPELPIQRFVRNPGGDTP